MNDDDILTAQFTRKQWVAIIRVLGTAEALASMSTLPRDGEAYLAMAIVKDLLFNPKFLEKEPA